jgi:hypothetical protein
MSNRITVLSQVLLIWLVGFPGQSLAVEFENSAFRISQLSWISGHWKGEMDGSVIQEIWSKPEGTSMIGMFQMIRTGQARFYEFMTIGEENGKIFLKLRHFSPGLVAWEDKESPLTFELSQVDGNLAVFNQQGSYTRLHYRSENPDSLIVRLEEIKDGKPGFTEFRFRREK